MDIRNFFAPANKSKSAEHKSQDKKRKKNVIESDDEENPLPSKIKKCSVLASDSDDEIFVTSTKNKISVKKSPSKKKQPVKKRKSIEPPKLIKTEAKNFFGSAPVSQSKVKTPVKKKKVEVHTIEDDDDDFEQTLLELDEIYKPKVEEPPKKPKPTNENSPPNKIQRPIIEKKESKHESSILHAESSQKKDSPLKDKTKVNKNVQTPKSGAKKNAQSKTINKTPKGKLTKSKVEFIKHESPKVSSPMATPPPTPEMDEKKRQHSMAYKKYLQRSGPKNPGGRPLPKGADNCLLGLTFVLTGVLETIDREETAELIKKFGGKVTTSLSKNTKYLIAGDEPGESKMKKAEQLRTKLLNEDELFTLISTTAPEETVQSTTPKKSSSFGSIPSGSPEAPLKRTSSGSPLKGISPTKTKKSKSSSNSPSNMSSSGYGSASINSQELSPTPPPKVLHTSKILQKTTSKTPSSCSTPPQTKPSSLNSEDNKMWVDKYKPTSLKAVIGQNGDQSNAKKLVRWLTHWFDNQRGDKKNVKPSPWSKDKTGAYFKAALLSGPPGVGKTSTAHLSAKELGFDMVELNASDARSKKTLEEHIQGLLSNTSLSGFASGATKSSTSRRHLLVMDEVDGMAGNEDRGGVQELISLIKGSKIPIICMCNDRNHPKIRSLANHCFDLRFYKPRLEQIRGAMMSVCFKEGIKIKPDALDQVIMGSNQDVRQILNHLSMWSADQKNLDSDQMKKDSKMAKKDMKMGPWDVVQKVFSESAQKEMSIHDKVSLFFHDYSIGPLFVQENYLKVMPQSARGNSKKLLQQIAKTAQSLTDSDLVDKAIRSESAWSLLPMQALYSSVIPGYHMKGHFSSQVEFPKWLGNNSRKNKFERLSQELHMHMRLRISGTKRDIITDYGTAVRNAIVSPLVTSGSDGVKDAVEGMTSHDLIREDLDSLIELSSWPGIKDPMSKVETKVKSAFTRTLNKDSHMNPFSSGSTIAKKAKKSNDLLEEEDDEEIVDEDNDDDDDDISSNSMIKNVKKTDKKATSSKASKGSKKTTKKSK